MNWWKDSVDEYEKNHTPEDIKLPDFDSFRLAAMPLLRKVVPSLIGSEIVGVQPMIEIESIGTIFKMKYTYNI